MKLILESPIPSVAEYIRHHSIIFRFLPSFFIRDNVNVVRNLSNQSAPVLILHGGADAQTPSFANRVILSCRTKGSAVKYYPQGKYGTTWSCLSAIKTYINQEMSQLVGGEMRNSQ